MENNQTPKETSLIDLFLVPQKLGNYARIHGQNIIAVQAKSGRNNDVTVISENHQINGLRFIRAGYPDDNDNAFYLEVSNNITRDFIAYLSAESAEAYLQRDDLIKNIRQYNIDALPLDVLRTIMNAINNSYRRV